MSFESLTTTHIATAVSTGAAGYALYRYGNRLRGLVTSSSSEKSAIHEDGDLDDFGSNSLVVTILKNRPKNMDRQQLRNVIRFVKDTIAGKPMNDRLLAMESIISIVGAMPPKSKHRAKLTNFIITGLWDSLEHPPISFHGAQFHYRTADGSYNNVHFPNLGKAGSPYARSIANETKMLGAQPDPGMLFDLLMKREEGEFKVNEGGISSMLFYHATLIIHDIFRTDRYDQTINRNSSYLDLSPLYGSCVEDQHKVREMKNGLLKPDTFHDDRLIGQTPGANVLLVLYSRFHNHVAQTLRQINEGGRFTLRGESEEALAKQDEDLFQTARLHVIVGGMYINISLHDYLRAILNTHHSDSTWTLDPRVEMPDTLTKEGAERGIGNQVTSEFNLLYRFHSTISQRDEKWLDDFFGDIFAGTGKPIDELELADGMAALGRFAAAIPKDPSQREFGGLKRGENGKFNDADLVKILKDGMEDAAGSFGPRNTPKALRVVEILGIHQARQWKTASLNEFRKFFNLKPHETFEDINPDPAIADTLRNLYGHVDLVEAYPALYCEDAKPRMDAGSGVCTPYTVGRAVLSDAITLVRSDRFNTTDFNAANLTNWGMAEVMQDYETLGGSMFYKLIQRALPGWWPYNNIHVMQPMYTKEMNIDIAKEIGTSFQYTEADPKPPPQRKLLLDHASVTELVNDSKRFLVPFNAPFAKFLEGRDFSHFMLAGDAPRNRDQRNVYGHLLYGSGELKNLLADFIKEHTDNYLNASMYPIGKNSYHVDVVKDVAIPVMTRFLADLFQMDLKTDDNPRGFYDIDTLYEDMLNIRVWGFANDDPALAWNRRRKAQASMKRLLETTEGVVSKIAKAGPVRNFIDAVRNGPNASGSESTLRAFGRDAAAELLATGRSVQEVAETMIFTCFGGIGAAITSVTEILHFLVAVPENEHHLEAVRSLAREDSDTANNELRRYILEIQRITATHLTMRVAATSGTIGGQSFQPGDQIIGHLSIAQKDPTVFPDPGEIKLDRPLKDYLSFGHGPHRCFGRELALTYLMGVVKYVTSLKNVRPAKGAMGVLKTITQNNTLYYLSEDWSSFSPYASTWQLEFEDPDRMAL